MVVSLEMRWRHVLFGSWPVDSNVRAYVTHDGTPGVYFFSLDIQGVVSVVGARLFHALSYYYARISLGWDRRTNRNVQRRCHASPDCGDD